VRRPTPDAEVGRVDATYLTIMGGTRVIAPLLNSARGITSVVRQCLSARYSGPGGGERWVAAASSSRLVAHWALVAISLTPFPECCAPGPAVRWVDVKR
jgi:hypothetical protein